MFKIQDRYRYTSKYRYTNLNALAYWQASVACSHLETVVSNTFHGNGKIFDKSGFCLTYKRWTRPDFQSSSCVVTLHPIWTCFVYLLCRCYYYHWTLLRPRVSSLSVLCHHMCLIYLDCQLDFFSVCVFLFAAALAMIGAERAAALCDFYRSFVFYLFSRCVWVFTASCAQYFRLILSLHEVCRVRFIYHSRIEALRKVH